MKNKVLKLKRLTDTWISNVAIYGNQCASTDRIVEDIIKTAKELEVEYNKEVPIMDIENMDIEKILTISTAHITEETNIILQNAEFNNLCLSVYQKECYGYWIYIGKSAKIYREVIPEDLLDCIEFARQNDCQWLCLDCDAKETSELPTYDW